MPAFLSAFALRQRAVAVAAVRQVAAAPQPSVGLEEVLALVQRTAGGAVDADAPLMEAGLDSLGAVELRNGLQAAAGEGLLLPAWRLALITDREFFGQQNLTASGYVRRRRRAASRTVDPNRMRPGDFVVHRNHGIGRFLKIEKLAIGGDARDYLVVQYADGLLRVAADQLGSSRVHSELVARVHANTNGTADMHANPE